MLIYPPLCLPFSLPQSASFSIYCAYLYVVLPSCLSTRLSAFFDIHLLFACRLSLFICEWVAPGCPVTCLPSCLYDFFPPCLSTCLSASPSPCLLLYFSFCLPIYLPFQIYAPLYAPTHTSVCPSVFLLLCLSASFCLISYLFLVGTLTSLSDKQQQIYSPSFTQA